MRKPILLAIPFIVAGCQSAEPDIAAPLPGVAPAPQPSGVSDLAGVRGSSGESELMRRGYTLASTRGLTAYWWNAGAGLCVEVVTGDGRYQSVTEVRPDECNV